MKIDNIVIQNFRCFENLSINFEPNLTIFVGENGAGKTAILDAIATAFGRLLTRLPGIKGKSLKLSDINIVKNEKLRPFTRYQISTSDFKGNTIRWSGARKRDKSKITSNAYKKELNNSEFEIIGFKEINSFADSLIDKSNNDDSDLIIPIIVYYGTSRAIVDEVQRRRNFRKKFSRFDSLEWTLEPDANFRAAFEWFNAMEEEERREQVERKNFGYSLPALNAVRDAISSMLDGFENPRTATKPFRFVIDRKDSNGHLQTFRISQLSDGYRTMLGLVMDLARRMAEANPPDAISSNANAPWDVHNPLHMPAIVLIDEIDLHLHPKWQQRIITDLQRTFPNTQFILTTHSPQVLTCVKASCIRLIRQKYNSDTKCMNHIVEFINDETQGVSSANLLAKIMDVDPIPDILESRKLSLYHSYIQQNHYNSPEGKKLRSDIENHFGIDHQAIRECDRMIRLQKFKQKLPISKGNN